MKTKDDKSYAPPGGRCWQFSVKRSLFVHKHLVTSGPITELQETYELQIRATVAKVIAEKIFKMNYL